MSNTLSYYGFRKGVIPLKLQDFCFGVFKLASLKTLKFVLNILSIILVNNCIT